MAEFTPNYNLKKPRQDDFYNIEDFNENADIIDAELKKLNDVIEDLNAENITLPDGKTISEKFDEIKTEIGNIEELDTDIKANVIAAINEIFQALAAHKADDVSHMTSTDINNLQTVFNSFVGRHIQGRPVTNANNATITGFYYLSTGASNKPTSNDGALFVISYSAIWVTQVVLDWRTNKLYSRACNNGTWTSWEEITTQAGGVVTGVGAGFENKRYTIHVDSDGLYLKEV